MNFHLKGSKQSSSEVWICLVTITFRVLLGINWVWRSVCSLWDGEYCLSPVSWHFSHPLHFSEKIYSGYWPLLYCSTGSVHVASVTLFISMITFDYHLNLTNIDLTKRFYFIITCNKKSGDRLGRAAMGAPSASHSLSLMLPCLQVDCFSSRSWAYILCRKKTEAESAQGICQLLVSPLPSFQIRKIITFSEALVDLCLRLIGQHDVT